MIEYMRFIGALLLSMINSEAILNKAIEPKKRHPIIKTVVLIAIVDKGSFKYFLNMII